MTGNGGWESHFNKAKHIVSQMTLEEKANMTIGLGLAWRCEGHSGSAERLGIPEFCYQDGPAGVRASDFVTVFPAGVTTGATFNRDLMYRKAKAIGEEFRAKGVHVALEPVTGGPLGRSPYQGRNWEGPGSDPYLVGEYAYQTVAGTEDAGVIATSKHFILYEQELWRQLDGLDDPWRHVSYQNKRTYSANADDRTLHELYLWPFMNAVRAGTGAIMTVYNRVNHTQGTESSYLLNDILKEELGFQGFAVSDWYSAYDTVNTFNAGLDVIQPGGIDGGKRPQTAAHTVEAVRNGSMSEARLDDAAIRRLTQFYRFNHDDPDYPTVSFKDMDLNSYDEDGLFINHNRDVRGDHDQIAFEVAQEGITLVKNTQSEGKLDRHGRPFGLPLTKGQKIGVFGSDAGPNPNGLNACQNWLSIGTQYCHGNSTNNGTLAVGWGSGGGYFTYLVDPLSALSQRIRSDRVGGIESNLNNAAPHDAHYRKQIANQVDAALVFVQASSGENVDRFDLELFAEGSKLVQEIASWNNNTIVVMHNTQQVLIDEWFNHPNVTAVIMPHLPGQESGNSLVPVLYGDVSPSGKMPYSMLKRADAKHYPTIDWSHNPDPHVNFDEGLFIDYRQWDKLDLEPLLEFGFGLSYTTFEMDSLSVTPKKGHYPTRVPNTQKTVNPPGGPDYLWDYLASVSVKVKNTGCMDAKEVAQLYIRYPSSANTPPKQLRGFDKVEVPKSATRTAKFSLTRRDFSVWDVVQQKWVVEDGEYEILVGNSSRNLPLSYKLTLEDGNIVWGRHEEL
ncbi:hypothetical protein BCV70DRAFT_159208 [Testicularia cyperi]|uniref:beta-glucosidase n=1 Tax=Testicularia cyperi TaxID=1882483 RepID=A0A317XSE7_9BASI|nr:hypothetical protein BCV70DRAFT_159208 [Testicularia cyperi]